MWSRSEVTSIFIFFLALKSIEIVLKKRWSYLRLLEHSFEPPASKSETPASFHLTNKVKKILFFKHASVCFYPLQTGEMQEKQSKIPFLSLSLSFAVVVCCCCCFFLPIYLLSFMQGLMSQRNIQSLLFVCLSVLFFALFWLIFLVSVVFCLVLF